MQNLDLTIEEEISLNKLIQVTKLDQTQLFKEMIKEWLHKNKKLIDNRFNKINYYKTPGRSKFLGRACIPRIMRDKIHRKPILEIKGVD